MDGQDGPLHCPRHSLKHIKECVVIASCLLQSQVPQYLEMSMYASFLELMDRFAEEAWPLIERGLAKESNFRSITMDEQVPAKYQCDSFSHPQPFVAGLQVDEETDSALAMSAVLASKSDITHKLLDSHMHNMSVKATISRVMEVWRPLCLEAKIFSCDDGNWWDFHYSSHRQTMALMQTGAVSTMRAEIRTRLRLERRVKAFMSAHADSFGDLIQSSSREGAYFDITKKSKASFATWKEYGQAGKKAMHNFVLPYSRATAAVNATRAMVWFDQVEFGKFQRDQELAIQKAERPAGAVCCTPVRGMPIVQLP
ncbi:unnamed protein product [Symbiodinium sp. CCMP2592]|nr:unnamed protein product [Symbiodinium sp. CCMP2592]